jgi:hypothetical protein
MLALALRCDEGTYGIYGTKIVRSMDDFTFMEMLIKSKFVIPANAGIRPKEVQSQENQRTGHRPSPV